MPPPQRLPARRQLQNPLLQSGLLQSGRPQNAQLQSGRRRGPTKLVHEAHVFQR